MSLKSRIQKLEVKTKPRLNPIVVIAMNGRPSPEDALLIERAEIEGRGVLMVNIASIGGSRERE